jgi:hypothetical protein
VTNKALKIANACGTPGTLAALVQGCERTVFALANHHVVFGGGAPVGSVIWAIEPESKDHWQCDAVPLGRAHRGILGRVTYAEETYFVDCALIELMSRGPAALWLDSLLEALIHPELGDAEPGARVTKVGAGTGYTEGVLLDVAYSDTPFIDGRTWRAPGQLLVGPKSHELVFSGPSDSGAGLVTESGTLIGLMWGSNALGQGVACPILPVFDALGVTPAHSPPATPVVP